MPGCMRECQPSQHDRAVLGRHALFAHHSHVVMVPVVPNLKSPGESDTHRGDHGAPGRGDHTCWLINGGGHMPGRLIASTNEHGHCGECEGCYVAENSKHARNGFKCRVTELAEAGEAVSGSVDIARNAASSICVMGHATSQEQQMCRAGWQVGRTGPSFI